MSTSIKAKHNQSVNMKLKISITVGPIKVKKKKTIYCVYFLLLSIWFWDKLPLPPKIILEAKPLCITFKIGLSERLNVKAIKLI